MSVKVCNNCVTESVEICESHARSRFRLEMSRMRVASKSLLLGIRDSVLQEVMLVLDGSAGEIWASNQVPTSSPLPPSKAILL
jgi:hypothetical protein